MANFNSKFTGQEIEQKLDELDKVPGTIQQVKKGMAELERKVKNLEKNGTAQGFMKTEEEGFYVTDENGFIAFGVNGEGDVIGGLNYRVIQDL